MLRYARMTTLDTVAGLNLEDLDHLHDADSNSIGGLLYHMAAVEAWTSARKRQRLLVQEERDVRIVCGQLDASHRISGHRR